MALSTCIPNTSSPGEFSKADVQDNLAKAITNVRKYESRLNHEGTSSVDYETIITFAVIISIVIAFLYTVTRLVDLMIHQPNTIVYVGIVYTTIALLVWRHIETRNK